MWIHVLVGVFSQPSFDISPIAWTSFVGWINWPAKVVILSNIGSLQSEDVDKSLNRPQFETYVYQQADWLVIIHNYVTPAENASLGFSGCIFMHAYLYIYIYIYIYTVVVVYTRMYVHMYDI